MMNGRVIASERPGHSILEGKTSGQNVHKNSHVSTVPNPLGVVAVLSAFNFPVAVYGWYAQFIRNLILLFTELGIWPFHWLREMRQFGSHHLRHRYVRSRLRNWCQAYLKEMGYQVLSQA